MMGEDFSSGNSLLHKLDARTKLIVAACFSLQVAVQKTVEPTLCLLALALVFLLFSRLSPLAVGRRLLMVNTLTLFIWLTLPLQGGETIKFGPLALNREGIDLALLITIKTNTALLALMSLLSTSTPADLGHGLERLHLPEKLCFILLFAYRYIFVIHNEYKTLLRAAQMRCFTPKSSLHTYRTFAYLFGMTLVKSHNRALRIHQAMVLRGFTGQLIPLKSGHINRTDTLFFCLASLAMTGILAGQILL
ncbi:cobalt ECF transporter T component CbiQ [Desulfotalea psychrophila]|uniref:Hypothetical membrane protein n=1 Tax=Desulfotalea psychrophila (strain LSv54 / DSM 12343) TaxID=177439 RepID=Q6AQ87_DESPS|nr:cobalt ECF transporter T component CbiQ [Desulfotalea psychrophila]CAG35486.1 hypothetical membrane protein [Desulfotalea psychrophila LSv54]